MSDEKLTFWDHLDELRGTLLRVVVCLLALTIVAFAFKEQLFAFVLAPSKCDFIFYRLLSRLNISVEEFDCQLINTELTGQFMAHIRVAFYVAVIAGAPYILRQLFAFISPGLYTNERRLVSRVLVSGTALFFVGVAVAYMLIFPLSYRFLALYVVDNSVTNLISLTSYLDVLFVLALLMGLMFEMPLVAVLLARLGFINTKLMRHYRRHAIFIIIALSAIITPTTDVVTLLLVAAPICILYEISILIIRK